MAVLEKSTSERINRYIVGCKAHHTLFLYGSPLGINRYIVGCKETSETNDFRRKFELIDT